MQKYSLYIFLALASAAVLYVTQSATHFIGMEIPDPTVKMAEEKTDSESNEGDQQVPPTETDVPAGKLKADVFSGTLQKVDTGCFADGECFVEVDGKHVTTLHGWSLDTVGTVQGVEAFGDLEGHIGEQVEVYAQVNPDNTYTLYGSEGFYVKLLDSKGSPVTPPKQTAGAGCVISGCSGQLCVDASQGAQASTCEWTEAYACYKTAVCEKQLTDGQCGWTETKELKQCLVDAKGDSSAR